MKENHDKYQVVLSVENYEALMKAATESPRGDRREMAKIRRHVRKFNSPQKAKRAAEVKEEESQKYLLRQATRRFVQEFEGKTVIVLYKYPDKATIGLPGTLKGYSPQGVGMVAVKLHSREFNKCIHLREDFVISVEEYERDCKAEIDERRREAFKLLAPEDPKTLNFRSQFLP